MTIIGRTNISWLKDIDALKELYSKALDSGCRLYFIIQHQFVENGNASDEEKEQIKIDHVPVVESFKKLKQMLGGNENIQLFLTKESIESSMTKAYSENSRTNKKRGYFVYDLNMNIKTKPSIIFTKNELYPEYEFFFELIRKNAMDLDKFDQKTGEISSKIDELIKTHDEYSSQRSNDNKKLLYHYYQKKKQAPYLGVVGRNIFRPFFIFKHLIIS